MSTLEVFLAAEQLRRRVPGGIGTYTLGLLKGIGELPEGARPSLTLVASRPSAHPDPLGRLGLRVASSALPGPLMTRVWSLGLGRVGRGGDVVHAVSLAAPPPAPGLPLVVTVHDVGWRAMPEAYPKRGARWHEPALRRAAAEATIVVVPSEMTAEAVVGAGVGIAHDRVVVVPHGADHLPEPDRRRRARPARAARRTGPVPAHRRHARAAKEPRAPR